MKALNREQATQVNGGALTEAQKKYLSQHPEVIRAWAKGMGIPADKLVIKLGLGGSVGNRAG